MDFNIKKVSTIDSTYKNEYIKGKFDIENSSIEEEFRGSINIEGRDWNIGVIVGPSGTGKSTIAQELFGDKFVNLIRDNSKSVVENIDKPIDKIISVFNKIGFNTPKSRLKTYNVLSNGEKMRVDLARVMIEGNIISD